MGQYIATARTNYFKVKDGQAFKDALKKVNGVDVYEETNGTFCLVGDDPDTGSFSSSMYDEDAGDFIEFDIVDIVSPHLEDDQVAIFVEAGSEKARYVVGYAVAVNNKNEKKVVSLQDIYKLAECLTSKPEGITTAEY